MSILRRLRRSSLAQTTTEYMLMISVVSIGLLLVLKKFSDPDGPVQQAGESMAKSYVDVLDNQAGMKMK